MDKAPGGGGRHAERHGRCLQGAGQAGLGGRSRRTSRPFPSTRRTSIHATTPRRSGHHSHRSSEGVAWRYEDLPRSRFGSARARGARARARGTRGAAQHRARGRVRRVRREPPFGKRPPGSARMRYARSGPRTTRTSTSARPTGGRGVRAARASSARVRRRQVQRARAPAAGGGAARGRGRGARADGRAGARSGAARQEQSGGPPPTCCKSWGSCSGIRRISRSRASRP
jgi:hypothetical protein